MYLWLIGVFIALLIIWLIWGGKPQEFVGVSEEEIKTFMGIKEIEIKPQPLPNFVTPKYRSKGERLCCETMNKIYGKPFYSVRPDFLRNPETGRNLEIDCYNDELHIGVEYNGQQHYSFPNFTGMSRSEFYNQVRRDRFKKEACDAAGVYLITVPYTVKDTEIEDYIRERLP